MFWDGFPHNLRDDVSKVVELIPLTTYHNVGLGISEDFIQYFHDNVVIEFPYRMYFIEVLEGVNQLSLQQKMILDCIYTRSSDGFVRQKHLRSLLQMDFADWAIPYIVKLADEYVVEILEMTYDFLKDQDTERFKRFCLENAPRICKGYARMTSYWNEYYRYRWKNFGEYIGRKLFWECFGYSGAFERRK